MRAQKLSIGRSASNDVVIDDTSVSRKHAEIFLLGGRKYRLLDSGSANGTFVKLDGTFRRAVEAEVEDHDMLRLGDYEIGVAELVDRVLDRTTRRKDAPHAESTREVPEIPSARPPRNPIEEVRPTEPIEDMASAAPGAKPRAAQGGTIGPKELKRLEKQKKKRAGATGDKPKRKMGEGVMVLIGLGVTVLIAAIFYAAWALT